jgi:uncharacterized protein YndB with AHSA1/START domain
VKNITKMRINKRANEIFEAFVDPGKIGGFWFSSSSERWEQGKTISLRYEAYNAQIEINITEIIPNEKIVFTGGPAEEIHTVTINFHKEENESTIVEVVEDGFIDDDDNLLLKMLDNKEGWVYMLTSLKAYVEHGVSDLTGALMK